MELLNLAVQHPFLAIVAVLVGLYAYSLATGTAQPQLPELPWVGKKDGQFLSLTRAGIASVTKGKDWLQEGYTKVFLTQIRNWNSC
jgi:hypothetical protein